MRMSWRPPRVSGRVYEVLLPLGGPIDVRNAVPGGHYDVRNPVPDGPSDVRNAPGGGVDRYSRVWIDVFSAPNSGELRYIAVIYILFRDAVTSIRLKRKIKKKQDRCVFSV